MTSITGGCLCGKVRYTSSSDPVMQAVCHCRNCQKQAGSAFSIIIGVPEAAITIEGELSTYEDRGISGGQVFRQFCGTCGSPVFSRVPAAEGLIFVKAGSLDNPEAFQPLMEFWTKSKLPWVDLGSIPGFEANP